MMLQTLGLKIGSAAAHPVGISLMHRPIPHQPGQTRSTTTSRPVGRSHVPTVRGHFPGRKR